MIFASAVYSVAAQTDKWSGDQGKATSSVAAGKEAGTGPRYSNPAH